MNTKAPNEIIKKFLIIIIAVQVILVFQVSQKRFFDFDEFQVLYTSASMIKGYAMYQDRIDGHFPLANILFAMMLNAVGFKTTSLLAARLVVIIILFLTVYLVYLITNLIRDKQTGLLAVALTLSSLAFVNKGIEIRHDVFNMFFNVMGAYWAIRYIKSDTKWFAIISGVCLGLALAATQKAFFWNFGILTGLSIYIVKEHGISNLSKILFLYVLSMGLTFLIVMLILIGVYNETLYSILKVTIIDSYQYLVPNSLLKTNPVVPFPYPKTKVLKVLLLDNGLFYIISIIAIIIGLRNKNNKQELFLIAMWSLSGLLFYLYMKRPFYQSFLPTIPPMGILAATLLCDLNKKLSHIINTQIIKVAISVFIVLLLIGWPTYLTAKMITKNNSMARQMQNVKFCLNNLNANDKVLCFSQQQIFFDPIFFGLVSNECGWNIISMDAKCVEKKMILNKCKLIIYDYRTTLLKKEILAKINKNFIYTGIGHILIPGFEIQPKSQINRLTWTPGFYYSPTLELMVNGRKINSNMIRLDQQINSFKNLTSKPVRLVYIFHPESFKLDEKKIINKYNG